jgi:hypothetical protein
VAGRATTSVAFATFDMTTPPLARLLRVDDTIGLDIEFRSRRSGV